MYLKLGKLLTCTIIGMILLIGCTKPKQSSDAPLTTNYNPSVIIGCNNNVLYALNPLTAVKNWSFGFPITAANTHYYSSPLLYNEKIYVANATGDTLYKLDAHTGALIKKITTGSGPFNIKATPVADGNIIFLACMNNAIYAIDTGTYLVKWVFYTGGPIESSPVVLDSSVYFGCDDGKVYAIKEGTGLLNWSYTPSISAPVTFTSSPAIGTYNYSGNMDTFLCIGSSGGDSSIYCLNITDTATVTPSLSGTLYWRFPTHNVVTSSPTIANGLCIVGSNDFNVYGVDILTGAQRWKVPTGSNVLSSPIVYNQTVYVGSNDYNLYAINISNGVVKWKFKSKGAISSSPLGYGPYMYIGSKDKNFYALDTAQGSIIWSYNLNNLIECSPVVNNLTGNTYNSGISGFVN